MASYFNNAKAYELQNRSFNSALGHGHVSQFGGFKVKGHKMSHGHVYVRIKCATTEYW